MKENALDDNCEEIQSNLKLISCRIYQYSEFNNNLVSNKQKEVKDECLKNMRILTLNFNK
jgi:hypothetical protein